MKESVRSRVVSPLRAPDQKYSFVWSIYVRVVTLEAGVPKGLVVEGRVFSSYDMLALSCVELCFL